MSWLYAALEGLACDAAGAGAGSVGSSMACAAAWLALGLLDPPMHGNAMPYFGMPVACHHIAIGQISLPPHREDWRQPDLSGPLSALWILLLPARRVLCDVNTESLKGFEASDALIIEIRLPQHRRLPPHA